MAWTAPASQSDGTRIGATIWNAQIYANLRYLKGLDGIPHIENGIDLTEIAAPATPSSGRGRLYVDTDGLLRSIDDSGRASRASYGRGTAFPGSWPQNVPFYREDLNWWCYYDGTRWLTCHEYEATIEWFPAVAYPLSATNTPGLHMARSDRNYYITRGRMYANAAATINGSNYWTIDVQDDFAVSIWSNQLPAAGALIFENGSINSVVTLSNYIGIYATKTGSPGNLIAVNVTLWYRLVVT